MIDLRVEDRNGVIVICALMVNPFMEASMPVLAFEDIDKFRDFVDMLNKFMGEKSTPIPEYIKDAFGAEDNG